ncbi:MAG: hypothetical protein JWL94_1433 [Microbacteriaceae bacterium]|jgi:hypothetical protein|nr:hypothetical protein [Microbacteriaceae bacterium]HEV7955566.1 hypothetical protein [Marisediminicola sp.]
MTDTQRPEGDDDLSTAPEYEQLGEKGNPFTGDSGAPDEADIDQVPAEQGERAGGAVGDQNPPLPDWGPTDGEHGVDGDTTTS